MIKGFHIDPWDGLIETVSVNLTVGWGAWLSNPGASAMPA